MISKKLAIFTALSVMLLSGANREHTEQEIEYRRKREEWMRSPQSPLALGGLFWLKPGTNTFGTDPINDIVLPMRSAPARVGHFLVSGKRVEVQVDNPSVDIYLSNQKIQKHELSSDADGRQADLLQLNNLRIKIIKRGDRMAMRLIDLKNPRLLKFNRLNFYKIDLSYRVEGKFVAYYPPKRIEVVSIVGQVEEMECPGVVHFKLGGRNLSLEPVYETPQAKQLYFMFKDATNGTDTYEGGRYLYSDLPRGDHVILNFNQAHNPYCAYNAYSTCQIPPRQNWLKVSIAAGEKKYRD